MLTIPAFIPIDTSLLYEIQEWVNSKLEWEMYSQKGGEATTWEENRYSKISAGNTSLTTNL